MKIIDLRSDTITKPTPEMRVAIGRAEVGDDVYGEDPTINRLEALGAEMTGKEGAVYVPSGTMGNQIAIMAWTERGNEIITEADAHIVQYEAGAPAILSQVQTRTIRGRYGAMDPMEVKEAIRGQNIHFPRTGLICIENTHNRSGGCVISMDNMKAIYEIAARAGVPVHLDGARVFNAACALGVDVKEITSLADSVQFCLSKGLCAPVGSLLVGSKEYIAKARRYRKILGGAMRQAGILAAAGILALTQMTLRLKNDHANAKRLAEGLLKVPGINIDMETVQSNMVVVNTEELKIDGAGLSSLMKTNGVLCNANAPQRVRLVTHNDVSKADIDEAIARFGLALETV